MNPDTFQRTGPAGALPSGSSVQPPALPQQSDSGLQQAKAAATDQARQTAADLKEGADEALQSAKHAGSDFIIEQKDKLAAVLEEYTHAVKAACDSLSHESNNPLTKPAERASLQLERASAYLREQDPMDLLHDMGEFARRRPELVFGGLFVAGLVSVRFLKASARKRRQNERYRSDGANGIGGAVHGARSFESPRREPFAAPAPVGPPPAIQTSKPDVLP